MIVKVDKSMYPFYCCCTVYNHTTREYIDNCVYADDYLGVYKIHGDDGIKTGDIEIIFLEDRYRNYKEVTMYED